MLNSDTQTMQKRPSSAKDPAIDFHRLGEGADSDPHIAYIRLPETQFMERCKDNAASPNAFLSVLFARAVRHYDLASEKTVSVSVSVDHKAMLGNYDSYRMASGSAELGFPKDMPLDDLKEACAVARKQLNEQTQPENSLWTMRQMKALCDKMNQVPLGVKLDLVSKDAGRSRWTISISYGGSARTRLGRPPKRLLLSKLGRAMGTPIHRVFGIHVVVLLPAMRTPGDILRAIPPNATAHKIAVAGANHLLKLVIGQLIAFRLCQRQNVLRRLALTQLIPLLLRQIVQIHSNRPLRFARRDRFLKL